jgi:MFS family permease
LGAFGEAAMVTWLVIYYEKVLRVPPSLRTVGFTCFMLASAVGRFSVDPLRGRFDKRSIIRGAGTLAVGGLLLAFVCSFPSPVSVALSSVGFVFTGLGISMLAPIAFSSVGQIAIAPQEASATSTTNADPDGDSIAGELSQVHNPAYEEPPAHASTLPRRAASEDCDGAASPPVSAASDTGSAVALVALFTYSGSIISSPLVGVIADATGSLRYGVLFVALVLLLIFPISFRIPPDSVQTN